MKELKPGLYRHFKGGVYYAIGLVQHSESQEHLVIYLCVRSGKMWVRPSEMFFGVVERGGAELPRFQRIETGQLPHWVTDRGAGAAYLHISEGGPIKTQEVCDGVNVDLADGRVVGLEIYHPSVAPKELGLGGGQ